MSLPDPQLMSDAQSLTVFAQAISQAAIKLVNGLDPKSPEFQELKVYFLENLPKLEAIINSLKSDLIKD